MKRQIIFASLAFVLCCALSVLAGYNLHCVLSGQAALCSIQPLRVLHGMLTIPRARSFAGLLIAASACGIIVILLMQGYIKYRSNMRQITPQIETPEAAGQGQYGTARWLKNSEISQVFFTAAMDINSVQIQELLSEADQEIREMQKAIEEGGFVPVQPKQEPKSNDELNEINFFS